MSDPSIGTVLRRARKLKKVSLHEASFDTRIRVDFLERMERDDFRFMSGAAYIRGLLRSYADYLDLEPSAVLTYFDELHGPPPAPAVAKIAKHPREVRIPFRINWLMAATVAALVLLVLSFVGLIRPVGQGEVAEAPGTTEVAGEVVGPSPQVGGQASKTEVTIEVIGDGAWLLVVADGKEDSPVFEGTLAVDETKTFTAERELRIVFGNLGAVSVTVNGRVLGTPGQPGEVGNFIFRSDTQDFTRE